MRSGVPHLSARALSRLASLVFPPPSTELSPGSSQILWTSRSTPAPRGARKCTERSTPEGIAPRVSVRVAETEFHLWPVALRELLDRIHAGGRPRSELAVHVLDCRTRRRIEKDLDAARRRAVRNERDLHAAHVECEG